jgi:hypothetical protein
VKIFVFAFLVNSKLLQYFITWSQPKFPYTERSPEAREGKCVKYDSTERVNECFRLWYSIFSLFSNLFFLIGIVGGGVQLGPLGTAATNRPIVPAPGDYDDGEIGGMIGRGNRRTRRKPAPMLLCPS